ncbi:DUF6185 family protein [Streptomyces zhihengii]|uniref:Integral membrane protein n=1 Tax=Streptomyces zhihengii TaxID=1818004 RepID=A0ABS2UJW8_9ACTN|nr:DUF6185 family protein [Streptomyces zhihengii]MBM9617633.1 hypothetical protein [Streptomyces zhihengii]
MRLVFVVLVTVMCWTTVSGTALGAANDRTERPRADCAVTGLSSARATASLRLSHHGRTHSKAESTVTLRVPASWPLAADLLLSKKSAAYRHALRCLLRGEPAGQGRAAGTWGHSSVRITSGDAEFRVRLRADAWIDERRVVLGPWRIDVGLTRWTMRFSSPSALRSAHWDTVEMDPGTPGVEWARPMPSAGTGAHALVWKSPATSALSSDQIQVRTAPPWQRAWAARDGRDLNNISALGNVLWMAGATALALTAVRRARARPAGTPASSDEEDAMRRLGEWAPLSLALGTLGMLQFGSAAQDVVRGTTVSAVTGLVLAVLCRRGAVLPAVTGALGAAAVASSFLPSSVWALALTGVLALTAMSCGALAWVGQLLPVRRPVRLRVLLPSSVTLAAALVGCHVWMSDRAWGRVSWLGDPTTPEHAQKFESHLVGGLQEFASDGARWLMDYGFAVAPLAALALLRARGTSPSTSQTAPGPPDILLMLLLYTSVVTPAVAYYLNNGALTWIGIVLDVVVLRLLLLVGDRRATLAQRLETSGRPLRELFDESHRADFLARARQYRELHAGLRRLDGGQSDETTVTRAAVERRLRRMHQWRNSRASSGPAADRLPSRVTVVDIVLAWGPKATWWENGRQAAACAAVLAAPASILMVWRGWIANGSWETSTWGAAESAFALLLWMLGWTGAGFLLGALWRLLPGRRGPARALWFTLAYALPTVLDAGGRTLMDEGLGDMAFDVSLTLLILTLTALAMDVETFRSERRYWPSRLSLLLSVYQLRYLALQAAYLIAQVVAAITIWQFVTDGGGPVEGPAKLLP